MSLEGVPHEVAAALEGLDPSSVLLRAPLVAIDAASGGVAYANGAALDLFGAADLDQVERAALLGDSPGAKRFRQLARMLAAGAAPRVERLRFFLTNRFETLTWRMWRPAGSSLLIATLVGAASSASSPKEWAAPMPPAEPPPIDAAADGDVEQLKREWVERFGPDRALRFLWRTDGGNALTAFSGPFCDVVGLAEGELLGRHLADVAEACGADPGRRLREALSQDATTWSKIELFWPVRRRKAAVGATFGAAPAFAADKSFDGWRGFGVVDLSKVSVIAGAQDEAAESSIGAQERAIERWNEAEPALGPNVVSLRRPRSADEAGRTILPAHGSRLTSDERLAFEEIARALSSAAPEDDTKIEGAAVEEAALGSGAPAADAPEPEAGLPADSPSEGSASASEESAAAGPAIWSMRDSLAGSPALVFVSRGAETLWANHASLALTGAADAAEAAERLAPVLRDLRPDAAALGEARRLTLARRGGEPIFIDAASHLVDWDDGRQAVLTLAQPTSRDESARVRGLEAELRLRDAEARELHSILNTATDGVAVLDADARLVSLNRAGEALFDCDQNEVAGEPFVSLLAADSHAAALDYFHQVASNGVGSLLNDGREIVGRARRGGAFPIFMTLGRVNTGGGSKFCAVLRDMTAWKKVERELKDARSEAERASALKSDFLAKVSHEIRTPLNAILGFAEVIMDQRFGPVGNERYRDYLKDIHASGTHVMSLVNDLLDLSKIEAGKMDLKFESVDANKIVAECVSIMQPQANSERVIVRLSTALHLPRILADERALRQIVLNLLSNAVKFNEPGGQVIVSTALTDAGYAVIRIRDTGIGMSDSELVTALEPFRQVQTSRQTSGTGLGLPLTKALVEANRANFIVKSKKAEGTLVEVTFPPARVMAE